MELIGCPDDRATTTDEWTRLLVPMCLGAVEKVGVPNRTALRVRDVLAKPLSGQFVFIPEVRDAPIVEELEVDERLRIAGEHIEPDDEHP